MVPYSVVGLSPLCLSTVLVLASTLKQSNSLEYTVPVGHNTVRRAKLVGKVKKFYPTNISSRYDGLVHNISKTLRDSLVIRITLLRYKRVYCTRYVVCIATSN